MKILKLSDISKQYNDITVLDNANAEFTSSKITCVMGQSGAGKTTLLNIIMGVVKADKGIVEFVNDNGQSVKPGLSAVFQDCRLIEHLTPVVNVKMVLKKNNKKKNKKNSAGDGFFAVKDELLKLLDKEALDKPCSELSGGMKRRVEIVRAVMAESDIAVMDEPFAGLDEVTKDKVINYIMNNINNRVVIISTHDEEDVKKLSANVLYVDNRAGSCYNNV